MNWTSKLCFADGSASFQDNGVPKPELGNEADPERWDARAAREIRLEIAWASL
jgi:hypothetical protein